MRGIDYGLGRTNIDRSNGIRYGVIHHSAISAAWYDYAEADYGEARCPKCGSEATDFAYDEDDLWAVAREYNEDAPPVEQWDRGMGCGDWACPRCCYVFDSDEAYPEEPLSFDYSDAEYVATQAGSSCDIFVTRSPYYTRATFCSPCAPGACSLSSPCDDGAKCYCFGHEWFESGRAPYPVFRVSDDSLVDPDSDDSDDSIDDTRR